MNRRELFAMAVITLGSAAAPPLPRTVLADGATDAEPTEPRRH